MGGPGLKCQHWGKKAEIERTKKTRMFICIYYKNIPFQKTCVHTSLNIWMSMVYGKKFSSLKGY